METSGWKLGRSKRFGRVAILIAFAIALLVAGKISGAGDHLSRDHVRALAAESGVKGAAIYLAAFVFGSLLWLPSLGFVFAAVLAWGGARGAARGYTGALCSLTVLFFLGRAVVGRGAPMPLRGRAGRLLEQLHQHPVRSVAAVRSLLYVNAAVTYALAASSVSTRDYLVGSALGLIPSTVVVSCAFELLLR